MAYGWRGKLITVDLTEGKAQTLPLSLKTCTETIGGIGLAARLAFDTIPADAAPLSPENRLLVVPGPLSGTNFPGTGRVQLAGRSPLTGLWGEASLGGYFATQLKRAGYDALVLCGQSPKPIVVVIEEDGVHLDSAAELWGQDTYITEDQLRERYPGAEVIAIGPAGERQVPMASLVHRQGDNVAARCGLGAVAGSKRVKAIVSRGSDPVPLADPDGFKQLRREAIDLFAASDFLSLIRRGKGTASATPIAIEMGDLPVRNWSLETHFWREEAGNITGEVMQTQWPSKGGTCYACPVGCKWTSQAPGLDGTAGRMAGPEYESLGALGAQPQIDDPLAVIQASDLCNRLGIDTISAGSTIAWAMEAYEQGILTEAHTDGMKLRWGDSKMVLEILARMAANRPGIGSLLAQGSRKAAQMVGGAEFAIHAKGLELPYHHPRASRGLEVAYATLPRGASHNEEGVELDFFEEADYEAWVRKIIDHMDLAGANNSMIYCQFLGGALNTDFTSRLLTAVTGVTYDPDQLRQAGARAWYLRRAFNSRLGVGLEADQLPPRIVRQIASTYAAHRDFGRTLKTFHALRKLDTRGIPAAETLVALGLDDLVQTLDAR